MSELCQVHRFSAAQGQSEAQSDLLNEYFKSTVKIPRIRVGYNQEIETLINEKAMQLARFLRNEQNEWKPRIAHLS